MLEGFSWLQDREAYCATFVQGLDEAELLRRFGGDLASARLIQPDDWEALEELSWFGDVIQVGHCDGWAFVYENNGYNGTLAETLQRVSAGTVAVSVFRNVNAHARFSYVEDGRVLTSFDPVNPPLPEEVSPRIAALLRQANIPYERFEDEDEDDYDFDYDFIGTMFALAEASGVRLDLEAIAERPLLSSFIRNPFSDFVGDLLTKGSDEQTVDRFLGLLNDWSYRDYLLRFLSLAPEPEEHWHPERTQLPEHLHTVATSVLDTLLSAQITRPVLKVLEEGEPAVRAAAAKVLKTLVQFDSTHDREEARERLLLLASAPEPEVALQATMALGKLGDQRAIKPLLHLLPLYPGRREIVQLLGQLKASSAVAPLFNMLDPNGKTIDVQRDIVKALEEIEGTRIVDRLLPLLQPEPQTMRECSFQQALLAALGRQGDASIVGPLLRLLNPHPEAMYAYDFQLRLLEALGNLGEKQAVEPLAQLLVSDFSDVHPYERIFQEYLVKALRQLGDTRPELQAIEEALQHLAKTTKTRLTVTFRRITDENREE